MCGGEGGSWMRVEFSLRGRKPLSTGTTMRGQNRVKISLLLQ
jgi:hypothetical protein